MKTSPKEILASNLVTLILILILLSIFDQSEQTVRNILIVWTSFAAIMIYDLVKWWRNRQK
ncbi:sec-independent periplasmic protein translocation protein TatC [Streptococcus sp. HF-1907]|uniref:sec-independent periplasmic protein translocation protein TatC n=1 Tax=Streptococcus sp. HF-1907 TaxID=2785793 RepID=UPI00189CAA9A|nr:sec-independent periplasmic protein translocation protein TatC [Streptococcus sp. HF-1907]MBF7094049.1 sec-independent periplasmic protein translocation protein TatC [Streptococcus sp. HF-1907]